jgi:hypothetical protein
LDLVAARAVVVAAFAVGVVVVVDFEAVEDRAVVAVVVVDAVDVSVLADATEIAVGAPAASHPVITIMPPAPVAPVIRRARRAGCGRRRVGSMGGIVDLQPQSPLGAA